MSSFIPATSVVPVQGDLDENATFFFPSSSTGSNYSITWSPSVPNASTLTILTINERYYRKTDKLYRLTVGWQPSNFQFTGTPNGDVSLVAYYNANVIGGSSYYENLATGITGTPLNTLVAFFQPVAGQTLTLRIVNATGATLTANQGIITFCFAVEEVTGDFTTSLNFAT